MFSRLMKKPEALKVLTFEPTLMFYFISINMSRFLGYNLLLRKACDPDLLREPDLTIVCSRELEAQHRVANINTWKALLMTLLPTMFLLIAGPWSDHHGSRRRPLIFIPIVGQIVTDLSCSLNAYFWNWSPEVTALFEIILPGLTGSETCLLAGTLCYVCDVTTEQNRTLRISVITVLYVTCGPIGAGMAGIVNVKLGFIGSFALTAGLNFIAVMVGFVFITDTSKPYDKTAISFWSNVNFDSLVSSVKMVTKPRPNSKRFIMISALLVRATAASRIVGESSVMYLFVRRKFNWNEVDYSVYTAYKMVTILVGTLFSIGLLSHCLKINDALVGTIGTSVDTVAAVLYFLVSAPWQMYIIPIVDMFHGAALTLAASISTKCVESNELGKLNTIQAVLSALFPIMISPIYSQVYNLTLERMASSFFIISTIISVPTILLFGIVYCKSKQREAFSEGINYDAANVEQSNKQIPANATELPVASTVIGRN